MKILAKILAMSALVFVLGSCDDDDEDNSQNTTTFSTSLSGDNEVPPNDSDASGIATLVFNENTGKFNLSVSYSGITATDAHIHKAAVGESGPAIFPIPITASPLVLTDVTMTAEQEADLKNGLYYVNIHSAEYPAGEIRGQLTED